MFTIPHSSPFADTLARWVLAGAGGDPRELAQRVIFLPTRRAVRGVQEAFLRHSNGQALLLPQLISLADCEESFLLRHGRLSAAQLAELEAVAPLMPETTRLAAMQKLVARYGQQAFPQAILPAVGLDLAVQLLAVIDQIDREGGQWQALESVIPEDLASHWQQNLQFLQIIRQFWPEFVAKSGQASLWQRRNALLGLLACSWAENPPCTPVILAGITQPYPAILELAAAIEAMPQGSIILPGLEPIARQEAPLNPCHPQAGLQQIVQALGVTGEQLIEVIGYADSDRDRLLSIAMIDAAQSELWQSLDATSTIDNASVDFLTLIQARNLTETALSAALLLRESLEDAQQTAALITPDRDLARAVVAHLRQWQVAVDDSAGQPLAQLPQSVFLFLLLEAAEQGFTPLSLLALAKHPLFALGQDVAVIRAEIRHCEQQHLRGMFVEGWAAARPAIAAEYPWLAALLAASADLQALLQRQGEAELPLADFWQEWLRCAEVIATNSEGICRLWQGDGAEELAEFFAQFTAHPEAEIRCCVADIASMTRSLMQPHAVRPRYGRHPRIAVLSPNEARLQSFDRAILADLNEGNWPALPSPSPWLNRAMQAAMGLAVAEAAIGQSAHDFVQQMASAKRVFLLRSQQSGGAGKVASRFWQRVNMALQLQLSTADYAQLWDHPVVGWAQAMLQPPAVPPARRPQPKPPLAARPKRLSVTRIDTLRQDPYSIYAARILRLYPSKKLEPEPAYLEWGNWLHKVLEVALIQKQPLLVAGQAELANLPFGDAIRPLWWPRFERIAQWVEQQEFWQNARQNGRFLAEHQGEWVIPLPSSPFTLTAKSDLLSYGEAGLKILDYKTGSPPDAAWQLSGMASQLVHSALIAQHGGFAALPTSAINASVSLEYIKLGGYEGGEIKSASLPKGAEMQDWLAAREEALRATLISYHDEKMPYTSVPDLRFKPRFNDYEQLARMNEWLD